MITPRGYWLLLAGIALAAVGAISAVTPIVATVGLSILFWMLIEWSRFWLFLLRGIVQLKAERTITQRGREVRVGWAGAPLSVKLSLKNTGALRTIDIDASEVGVPRDSLRSGSIRTRGTIAAAGSMQWEYELVPPFAGIINFAGVHLRLADASGLFSANRTIPLRDIFTIIPTLIDCEGRQRASKRFNALPPPGIHRHRMPGSGSELLDLREYRPGDPPKMIAWKASARRDRLITKEYESDVPVRCVILLDASNVTRIPAKDGSDLQQYTTTAAGILQAASANRDLVGITIFDADRCWMNHPARTRSHLIKMLELIAQTAARKPDLPIEDSDVLLDAFQPVMFERYPELFDDRLNSQPLGMHWRPLLDTRFGWTIFIPFLLTPFFATNARWIDIAARVARAANPATGLFVIDLAAFLIGLLGMLLLPAILALAFWMIYSLQGFLPFARRRANRRKQVAAALCSLDRDDPHGIERYRQDDAALASRIGRFAAEEHVTLPIQRLGHNGTDRFQEPNKLRMAADALTQATMRARDNELFVIFISLQHLNADLAPLLRAIRHARSRHHQILVFSVWRDYHSKSIDHKSPLGVDSAGQQMQFEAGRLSLVEYRKFRHQFTKAGAVFQMLDRERAVTAALDSLDRLRGTRSRS